MPIAIIQPTIPHYRNDFFLGLQNLFSVDFFCYVKKTSLNKTHNFKEIALVGRSIRGVNLYFNSSLFSSKYKVVVCMLSIVELSTWLLLLTKPFHKKKIIVWGQGVSIPKYIEEIRKPSFLKRLMIYLADEVWLYTEAEQTVWRNRFPNKPIVSLNNTISSLSEIIERDKKDKKMLREKYGIDGRRVMICCTRFETEAKRGDLLFNIMKKIPTDFTLVLIGGGKYKPDFSDLPNVYDFGPVYDSDIKNELFGLSDIYIQPAWIGLSVVEAMAYGLPIFTYQRSGYILQCVEYTYIKHGVNGYVAKNENELLSVLTNTPSQILLQMGTSGKSLVMRDLKMSDMVEKASESIKRLLKKK